MIKTHSVLLKLADDSLIVTEVKAESLIQSLETACKKFGIPPKEVKRFETEER